MEGKGSCFICKGCGWEKIMGVRKHLDRAVGELLTARRRAELKKHSRELLYNMEVLIRAISRVKDQIKEENHVKQKTQQEEEIKAFEKARQTYTRAKRQKAKKTRKRKTKERTRKAAA